MAHHAASQSRDRKGAVAGLVVLLAVAAFASVAMTAMVGKTKPRDARRCLREKFTADSTEGKGFRDRTNNVW